MKEDETKEVCSPFPLVNTVRRKLDVEKIYTILRNEQNILLVYAKDTVK